MLDNTECMFNQHTRPWGKYELPYIRLTCEYGRLRLKCDGTRPETRFPLSAKRTSPFKGASVLSTTGSRGVRISGSNVGYTMFQGTVKSTGYPFHSPVSPSLPSRASPCHHISTGLYQHASNGMWRMWQVVTHNNSLAHFGKLFSRTARSFCNNYTTYASWR